MTVDNPPAQDERFGRRYRVVFNDGTRKPKQVIVTFLEQVGNEYVFDTRPKAGTLRMRGVNLLQGRRTAAA